MTISREAAAAMFDLPPPEEESSESTAQAAAAALAVEAEEAALAAELAATIESGGFATDAPESRTDPRVPVSWPGRMQLVDGRVIEIEVRNVSGGGVGLMSDQHIPDYTVVNFEMVVPALGEGGQGMPVKGTIRTTYTVAQGSKILCGGTWQAPPAGLELVNRWIERLRP